MRVIGTGSLLPVLLPEKIFLEWQFLPGKSSLLLCPLRGPPRVYEGARHWRCPASAESANQAPPSASGRSTPRVPVVRKRASDLPRWGAGDARAAQPEVFTTSMRQSRRMLRTLTTSFAGTSEADMARAMGWNSVWASDENRQRWSAQRSSVLEKGST